MCHGRSVIATKYYIAILLQEGSSNSLITYLTVCMRQCLFGKHLLQNQVVTTSFYVTFSPRVNLTIGSLDPSTS